MAAHKHFLQDRTALLLASLNSFLALASVVLILLKLNAAQGSGNYVISYRPSLGPDRFTSGSLRDILSFILFAVLIYVVSMVLAYRSYPVKRELSLGVLGLSVPLFLFLCVVANALLVLR